MRLVHVYESLAAEFGGPPVYVAGLCTALARIGHEVHLCVPDCGIRPETAIDDHAVHVHRVPARTIRPVRTPICPTFRQVVKDLAADTDILHVHGIWAPVCHHGMRVARHVPYVVSPHGMLHASALRRSAWKKRLAWLLGAQRRLQRAACFHALTGEEARRIRQCGLTSPIAVLPSAVQTEPFDSLPSPAEADRQWPVLQGRRVVLFLGRIHPIKGLEHLLRAWSRLPAEFDQWHLALAGPDELGWWRRLEGLIADGGATNRISWLGPVYGNAKWALWSKAEAFVLPSFSEGQSCSLLEASAAALPSVVTPGSSLDGLVAAGGAMEATPDADAWVRALTELLALPDRRRQAMGRCARELVQRRYAWPAIAGQMAETYQWLLGQGGAPRCTDLDSGRPRWSDSQMDPYNHG